MGDTVLLEDKDAPWEGFDVEIGCTWVKGSVAITSWEDRLRSHLVRLYSIRDEMLLFQRYEWPHLRVALHP